MSSSKDNLVLLSIYIKRFHFLKQVRPASRRFLHEAEAWRNGAYYVWARVRMRLDECVEEDSLGIEISPILYNETNVGIDPLYP